MTLPPLARSTLDRAAHHRRDPEWLAAAWSRARVLVVDTVTGGRALIDEDGALVLLDAKEAPEVEVDQRLFLGVEPDGTPVFAVDAPLPEQTGARALNLREVGHLLSDRDAGLFTAAAALAQWHAGHPYSSTTGLPTAAAEGGWTRVDESGAQAWPRTDPAMIVLVHDGVPGPSGRCLLGNNAAWGSGRHVRRFSCLAGYVEPGESAEAAVIREVAEEVGIEVRTIDYQGSQAWPFPGSLMLGFTAVGDPDQPVRVDPAEIAHARWFTRAEIAAVLAGETVDAGDGARVGLPPASSIALYLVNRWLTEASA
ncbi:NAD(+) diphosphatase [Phytohabitans houttuyneae]|uniref:NAD(+) diphosphatase n=1 Tax=Phytohabitans houttuyneae TaxID=1076126 RepID=A0A6V8KEB2_9ACTN|nr:NAD(+) diphosphatase [Phytohabitans houttuyneae]GFJ80678.1 putative NADH pyrophosphatase/NUDIX hydrolase [Phytohabitans houttuyneae]